MNLDVIMSERGVTNAQIATLFEVTPSTVSRWRNNINQPDNSFLPKLCDFLHCSLDDLLRIANPIPTPLDETAAGKERQSQPTS